MKTLTLLRHAKSGWNDPVARDFDRPLNGRGRRAAEVVGRHLKGAGLAFDHVVASPAARVVETLEHVEAGFGTTLSPHWDKRIYLASAATLLDVTHGLPSAATHVLMAGHNPGLEDLVLLLVSAADGGPLRAEVETKFPTASVATMTFDVDDWAGLAAGGATLVRFIRPRDLDPNLGPDAE
jgi:phosphohistidine phosphatase